MTGRAFIAEMTSAKSKDLFHVSMAGRHAAMKILALAVGHPNNRGSRHKLFVFQAVPRSSAAVFSSYSVTFSRIMRSAWLLMLS